MRRTLAFVASFSSLLVACSGGIVLSDGDAGSSSATSPAAAGGDTSSSSPTGVGTALDLTDIASIEVALGFCGGAPGKCYGTHSTTIDFDAKTVTSTACEDGDAGPTSRPLDAADADRIRIALSRVRVSNTPSMAYDGQMEVLQVTRHSKDPELYSPEATCNQGGIAKVEAGFDQLASVAWSL